MSKKSTIHDIAKALNVTASTVSRALSGHPRISVRTREAVEEMAKEMGYQHNQIASALRSGRSNIIGVMVPTAERSFFSRVVSGIEDEANRMGYSVIICQSNDRYENEKRNIEALLRLRVDGVIASMAKETQDYSHFAELKNKSTALVLFDRVNEKLGVNTVVLDDYLGAYQAVNHLISQGCKRIAHFAGMQHINIYRERLRGYKDALKDHGLPFDEQMLAYGVYVEDGMKNMETLLKLPQIPDAVFSASDFSALGAMQTLKAHHLRIPEDVALVGFANEPFTAYLEPSLSTIDQHSQEMGIAAAQMLFETIQEGSRQFPSRTIVLNPELLIRKSSLKT
jgi:LacI family transcriptional regulator